MQLLFEKIAKNDDFGDFKRFSRFLTCVTYDVTVTSYKVCSYFFWYQWTQEGPSYPLVPPHLMFPRSVSEILGGGGGIRPPPPPGCEMGPKSPALLGLRLFAKIVIMFIQSTSLSSQIHQIRQISSRKI